ncbi:MAG: hypothetical protein LBP65_04035 [Puniceicoccales bacterium]|nr:hypothetical protein [Puniceicoccales bacterium]
MHGRRKQGALHDISSLAVQVAFGDYMQLRFADTDAREDFISCDVPDIPTDSSNTIIRAAGLFRQIYDFPQKIVVRLEKNIPLESGLGGGSSDAALFLRNLNIMLGKPVNDDDLTIIAGCVGSDCPIFLSSSPCILHQDGRMERVAVDKLAGLRQMKLIVFKPVVGIATSWAYAELDRRGPSSFSSADEAKVSIAKLLDELGTNARPPSLNNCFQSLAAERLLELQLIFRDLNLFFRVQGYLTGTGSAGFIPLQEDADSSSILQYLKDVLGSSALIIETRPYLIS